MPSYALAGTIAAYGLLAVLLLSLNLAALWRWWVKAAAILVTAVAIAGSYATIVGLTGWPTTSKLPPRASLLWARIVEPDKATGAAGAIYVWLQGIDAQRIPEGEPRAYRFPYSQVMATKVLEAQRLRSLGRDVIGSFTYGGDPKQQSEIASTEATSAQRSADTGGQDRQGGAGTMFTLDQSIGVRFEEMPPLELPGKAPVIIENDYQ